ncbi:hypothetical protein L0F63_006999 [Massospora cicadina]|nr:hypothetical protein L0F63_006999 [Massospora cicadina]
MLGVFTALLIGLFGSECVLHGMTDGYPLEQWDTHLLVLDQPIGTGFSRGKGRLNSISLAAADIYKALLIFFDMFPQYQNRSFHMFSESYGGHYLFKIASLILEPHPRKIQLSSIGIGNGLIDPRIQFKAYFKMVCRGEHQLLPTAVCETINRDLAAAYKKLNACYRTLNIKSCRRAWKVVGNAISFPHIDNHNPLYNITNFRFRMDENAIRTNSTEFFFNQHHVQVSLGVSNGNYKVINPEVYKALYNSGEIMVSLKGTLESLLDRGVRVLLYAGDTDFLYNWLGLQDLTEQLDWRGARGFRAQRLRHYFDNETKRVAWQLRAYLDLCFIRFHEAGHMAYLNSPRLVQRMVQLWLNDDLLKESI